MAILRYKYRRRVSSAKESETSWFDFEFVSCALLIVHLQYHTEQKTPNPDQLWPILNISQTPLSHLRVLKSKSVPGKRGSTKSLKTCPAIRLSSFPTDEPSRRLCLPKIENPPKSWRGISTVSAAISLKKTPDSDSESLSFVCNADWPLEDENQQVDLACLDVLKGGEAELNRELLQAAYVNLVNGGALVASSDNPKDKWLFEQMQSFDKSVKVRHFDDGVVYYVIKKKPLKKVRNFECQIAFRDEDNLIQLLTRPGVFAHRQFDNGARQILDLVEVFPECNIIDIGCGSGPVSLALAKREPTANLFAIDSYSRAIDCLRRSAELNGLTNVTAELNHDGWLGDRRGKFDMAVANPPYYAEFRIAEHFIKTAVQALRTGGRLVLVTRLPKWYRENLGTWLDEVEVFESRRYHIATGITRA